MGAWHSLYHLTRLRNRLFWPPERLEAFRRDKLGRLLKYCYERIPYYRRKFAEIGAEPKDIQHPEDLTEFPILEKETLRDCLEEFLDPKADQEKWIRYRSSGSTGIPLELWYHPAERLRMGFTVTRELLFNGFKPWQRLVNITEPRHSASKNRWYHRLGFMNEKFLSVYDPSGLNLEQLRQIKPHAIIGFPSVLMLIGQEWQQADSSGRRPRLVFTLAEVLDDNYRQVLTEQFQVQPIDLYGANEVGHIAFQCPHRQGYHMNLDSLHVEILAGNQPAEVGERGEVVVTSFDLRAMPIIRYRVGDIAVKLEGTCDCGCRFPLMGHIEGRSDGFILGREGKLFSALEIALLLKPIAGIRQYRFIQEAEGRLRVEWVPHHPEVQAEAEIIRRLRERLGEAMHIVTERVAEIPREKSGKIRTVISYLSSPFFHALR